MRLRTLVLALAAGIATALLVGAGVTEALLPTIAFSAFVGLPVGIAAGLVVGTSVLLLLAGRDTPADQRHAATGLGGAGVATLLVFAASVTTVGATTALLVGSAAGVVVGVGTFVWLERNDSRNVHAVTSR